MATEGAFTIQELRRVGAQSGGSDATGEQFVWTSDRTPQNGVRGGARAAPFPRPWQLTGKLRTVRTDYPGAKTPSEQVLGPNHEPFSLQGKWDDRYNFSGYALEEMRRFEAMCRRGNLVRVQFQNQAFECLITNWTFDYHREWDIRYSFTVSVHDRPDDFNLSDRSPSTTKTATEAFDEVDLGVQASKEAQGTAPTRALSGNDADVVQASIDSMSLSTDRIGDTLDQRELGVSDDNQGIAPFRRLATQFREVQSGALQVLDDLISVRSDTELGYRTAITVLDFETWSRSMRFYSRIVMGQSLTAASAMDERDAPDAARIYYPHKGESLYAISRRFYGTPHAWRAIAERNALTDFELDGTEELIIPERAS